MEGAKTMKIRLYRFDKPDIDWIAFAITPYSSLIFSPSNSVQCVRNFLFITAVEVDVGEVKKFL